MAETVGAVASVAGLVSLSLQLVESTQKLKRLYDASRDAPSTVADLCFELETSSLSLCLLDSHRNADIHGDELLGRCVTTCTRMVAKIEEAVGKVERLLQRSRVTGRMYMAFKEPEIERLLVEMEHAKSSLSFAYMSYCQWVPTQQCLLNFLDSMQLLEYRSSNETCRCEYRADCYALGSKHTTASS